MYLWKEGDLTPEQEDAVLENDSIFLVACPGSGKTWTLTYKIVKELSQLNSNKKYIIAITYTHRAANEIHERIERMGINTNQLWIGTIHSFCLDWIIKPYSIYHENLKFGFRIINSHDTENIISSLCKEFDNPRPTYYDCGYFFDSKGINIQCTNQLKEKIKIILDKYHEILIENRQIDFELILYYAYELIINKPIISKLLGQIFQYILIDEYQDTKEIQYKIVSKILKSSNNSVKSFIVGDPNQAIYSTLGGYAIDLDELNAITDINFNKKELSANFRNSDRIVEYFSNFKVIDSKIEACGKYKDYKSLITFDKSTSRNNLINEIARLIIYNCENLNISPNEICVIAPWWIHLATLTRGLVGELPNYNFDGPGLTPFVHDRENFWYKLVRIILTKPSPELYIKRHRWAKEIISMLADTGINTSDMTAKRLLRQINNIKLDEDDGITFLKVFFDKIFLEIKIDYKKYAMLDEHYESFFQSSEKRIKKIRNEVEYAGDTETFYRAFEKRRGITVSSIHGIKGAEFDAVIAFAILEGTVPHFNDPNPRNIAKKLLYVIGSRARKNLHLISETGRKQNNPTLELTKLNFEYD